MTCESLVFEMKRYDQILRMPKKDCYSSLDELGLLEFKPSL